MKGNPPKRSANNCNLLTAAADKQSTDQELESFPSKHTQKGEKSLNASKNQDRCCGNHCVKRAGLRTGFNGEEVCQRFIYSPTMVTRNALTNASFIYFAATSNLIGKPARLINYGNNKASYHFVRIWRHLPLSQPIQKAGHKKGELKIKLAWQTFLNSASTGSAHFL